jgi:hypothetical protein
MKWWQPSLKYYPSIFLEGPAKWQETSVRIVCLRAEISTQDLSNIKQESYHSTATQSNWLPSFWTCLH